MLSEYSHNEIGIDWLMMGRAGPFQVYKSPQGKWFKLRRAEDEGKTVLEFVLTDREARDMMDCLSTADAK